MWKRAATEYQQALAVKDVQFETVESEGVRVGILYLENGRIELMEPTREDSPIRKFLDRRGEGLHHVALQTGDIEGDVARMEGCGIGIPGGHKARLRGNKGHVCPSQINARRADRALLAAGGLALLHQFHGV